MNNNDFKVLNDIYKGCKMGMNSISYMKDKIDDIEFQAEADSQYNDYKQISEKIESIINGSGKELEDANAKDKVMGWTSVKLKTTYCKNFQ